MHHGLASLYHHLGLCPAREQMQDSLRGASHACALSAAKVPRTLSTLRGSYGEVRESDTSGRVRARLEIILLWVRTRQVQYTCVNAMCEMREPPRVGNGYRPEPEAEAEPVSGLCLTEK